MPPSPCRSTRRISTSNTAQRSAFARDGRAAVLAFAKGKTAVAHSPAPHDVTAVDTFSLRGFEAAYTAINKACPPP